MSNANVWASFLYATFIFQQPTAVSHDAWTTANYIALVSAIAAVGSALAAFLSLWPYLRQRLLAKRISRDFGAELYLPEVIRASTRFYVRPDASSLDLAQEIEEPSNRVPTREDLFKAVERFLDDDSEHRHLFLLADSGMGKSAFVLNFYAHNQRRFTFKRYRLAVIPLGYAKAIERIRGIEDKRNTVIFLDAFDEDPQARDNYWARLKILLEECNEFRRVLITCRTQFFPKDDAIPVSTGLIKLGPRKSQAHYHFWRLYIAPLSDEQVDKYLRRRYRVWDYRKRKKARSIIKKIPLLSLRPMLLTHIPEIMAAKVAVTYSWQLYQLLIQAWYEREKGWWQDIKSIQMFSEEVAVKLHLNYLHQKADRIPRSELTEIIRTISVKVDEWNATSRSLLHRDAEGHFKFAHRSVMEYLVIRRFIAGDKRCKGIPWTDQMRQFMVEILRTPRTFEGGISIWERYDLVGADLQETDLTRVDLSGKNLSRAKFNRADLSYADCHRVMIRDTDFSEADLSHCNLTEARDDAPRLNKELYALGKQIYLPGPLREKEPHFGNQSEIAVWGTTTAEPPNFHKAKLQGATLAGAILCGATLDGADLSKADLKKTNLRRAKLRRARLNNADLRGARLMEADFEGADLHGALLNSSSISIVITSVRGANFSNVVGLSYSEIAGCERDEKTIFPPEFESLIRDTSSEHEVKNS